MSVRYFNGCSVRRAKRLGSNVWGVEDEFCEHSREIPGKTAALSVVKAGTAAA